MLSIKVFFDSIPKEGYEDNENEDAIALRPRRNEQRLTNLRLAIADGATQSSFSKLWANILVDSAIKSNLTPSLRRTELIVNDSYNKWQSNIERIELPWFAEERAKKGAFSSFLWVGMNRANNGNYANLSAVSIGDSELLIVRDGSIFQAFPLEKSYQFNSSPLLLSSKRERNRDLKPLLLRMKLYAGDNVILATDALSKYMLSQLENGNDPLEKLRLITQYNSDQSTLFKNCIRSLRKERLLKNDDSTIVWIHLFNNSIGTGSKLSEY